MFSNFSIKYSTSFIVLKSPNVILNAPCANSCGTPIAVNTCDGFAFPDEQADPPDAQIPSASSFNSNSPESVFGKQTLQFPGSLCSKLPLI